mmetsp:Transcript_43009/g.104562  ORF Transcript_43009/g.104562 Transcript_43009/m.104562 type:complete len:202 (+) Transcript_43009:182-787(+)
MRRGDRQPVQSVVSAVRRAAGGAVGTPRARRGRPAALDAARPPDRPARRGDSAAAGVDVRLHRERRAGGGGAADRLVAPRAGQDGAQWRLAPAAAALLPAPLPHVVHAATAHRPDASLRLHLKPSRRPARRPAPARPARRGGVETLGRDAPRPLARARRRQRALLAVGILCEDGAPHGREAGRAVRLVGGKMAAAGGARGD